MPLGATLLIVDMQKAIDHPDWGVRNNPDAERRGAALLEAWRAAGRPVVHIKHDSVEPCSHYRPGQSGNDFKTEFLPRNGERVTVKHTGSAFVDTALEQELRAAGVSALVVFGVVTNNSIETTVRHAGCLGFRVYLVEDACFAFARCDRAGTPHSAEEVHAMSLANLEGEYCKVVHSHSIVPGGL